MINWPKSSLLKRKRKVQQNILPNHQFCGQEEGAQWIGKERLRESSAQKASTCAPEWDDSADYLYNSVYPSSPSKLDVHHIEKENSQEALDFA